MICRDLNVSNAEEVGCPRNTGNTRKKAAILLIGLAAIMAWPNGAAAASRIAIIPEPQQVEERAGSFTLREGTKIAADGALRNAGDFLAGRLRTATGWKFAVGGGEGEIRLTTEGAPEGKRVTRWMCSRRAW